LLLLMRFTGKRDMKGLLRQAADVDVEVAVVLLETVEQLRVEPVRHRVAVVVREAHATKNVVKDLEEKNVGKS